MPARNYTIASCNQCGTPFRLPQWEAKRGRSHCSPQCGFKARSARRGCTVPLTQAAALDVIAYNPQTGVLTWKVDHPSAGKVAGDEAGYVNAEKYRALRVLGHSVLAHRLAWLLMTGEFPSDQIDHKNGKRDDNRWENLRVVNGKTNAENKHFVQGCTFDSKYGKWIAQIKAGGKQLYLGRFDSFPEAREAYWKSKRELHVGFTG